MRKRGAGESGMGFWDSAWWGSPVGIIPKESQLEGQRVYGPQENSRSCKGDQCKGTQENNVGARGVRTD